MKKFSNVEKEELVRGAQTAEASPLFDEFWGLVEEELLRMSGSDDLTIVPKSST